MKLRYWLLTALLVGTASCDTIVGPDPTPTELTMLRGDAQVQTVGMLAPDTLVVEVRDENGDEMEGATVEWRVVAGDATVSPGTARTDEVGTASAVVTLGPGAGAVRVEARAGQVTPVLFELTAVPDRPALVEPSTDSVTLEALADSLRVEATVFDRYGNEIPDAELTWSTSDSTIIELGPAGLIRSLAPGRAAVTLESDTASTALPVTVAQVVDNVALAPDEVLLTALQETVSVGAAAYDRNGYEIADATFEWTTGEAGVATVSAAGAVTAEGPGETQVTATSGNGSAGAIVRVEQEVAEVLVTAPADTLREPGDTLRLSAVAKDRNGYDIPDARFTWESNRSSIAVVDSTGLVTARDGRGDAWITARAGAVERRATVTRIPYGVLVLTFDDAHQDVYTRALPLLQEHGLVANVAVPTGWVGRTGGAPRLTEAQIEELHEAGWSIIPHTVDHPDLTNLTAAELDRQLQESRQWVRDRGYRGSEVFAVPFHRWYQREEAAVRSYFAAARGYGVEHSRHGGMVDWPASDPYLLTSIPGDRHFRTAEGRQQIEDWWAEAVSKGKFVGTYFHRIADEDMAALEDVIERLAAYGAYVRTYGDLFE